VPATDSSSISFTAYYTGQTWFENGMSAEFFDTREGRILMRLMRPIESLGEALLGMSVRSTLLQRHAIEDECIERAIRDEGYTQVIELACGLSPRGYRFSQCHGLRGVRYVEADLPDMASRKRALLSGRIAPSVDHQVVVCDILQRGTSVSLESVFARTLDPARKTLVVTEGLVNYFGLETMSDFWARVATLLRQFPHGRYLTDEYLQLGVGRRQPIIDGYGAALRRLSRSNLSLHFRESDDVRCHLVKCGFDHVELHDPDRYSGRAVFPLGWAPSIVRVVEASVGGSVASRT